MKKFFLMSVAALALGFTSCDKDDDDDDPDNSYTLSATANGAQEVPAVTTNATGTLTGTYNSETNVMNYTINWTGLSGAAQMMHFHGPALAGVNAGVAEPITGFTAAAAGSYTGSVTLSDAQEADLLAGRWYWNVHTVANGNGEIRGQISAQ